MTNRCVWLTLVLLVLSLPTLAQPKPVPVVAAENFYGEIAARVGGRDVAVVSILSNPNQDPHLFEASPSVARAIGGARLVIYNGADYDPWMAKLLRAARAPDRRVIVVADLLHKQPGDNPHLWYDPSAMPQVAKAIAASLADIDYRGVRTISTDCKTCSTQCDHCRQGSPRCTDDSRESR